MPILFLIVIMQVELAHGGRGPSSNDRRGGYGGGGGSGGRLGISRHSEFRGLLREYFFLNKRFRAINTLSFQKVPFFPYIWFALASFK